VRAGREPFADDADDSRTHAGQRRWKLDPVSAVELSALFDGLVFPGDAKKIDGVDVPKADVLEAVLDFLRHFRGVAHLREGGDNDSAFLAAGDGFLEDGFVDLHAAHFESWRVILFIGDIEPHSSVF
jgi:hypothetical protein